MKKFSINCDFGGQTAPFDFYIGQPEQEHHPLHFQADWLAKQRNGVVPAEVMNAIAKLKDIAAKNNVSLEDLCVYAIGSWDSDQGENNQDNKPNDSENAGGSVDQETEAVKEELAQAQGTSNNNTTFDDTVEAEEDSNADVGNSELTDEAVATEENTDEAVTAEENLVSSDQSENLVTNQIDEDPLDDEPLPPVQKKSKRVSPKKIPKTTAAKETKIGKTSKKPTKSAGKTKKLKPEE